MTSLIDSQLISMSTSDTPIPRGLKHARRVRDKAREQYKSKQNFAGSRIKKNSTSVTAEQKYHRRLANNQASAAATKYAHEAYIANLELQVRAYHIEMTDIEGQVERVKYERDEHQRQNAMLVGQSENLRQQIEGMRAQLASISTQPEKLPKEQAGVANRDNLMQGVFEEQVERMPFADAIETDLVVLDKNETDLFGHKNRISSIPEEVYQKKVDVSDGSTDGESDVSADTLVDVLPFSETNLLEIERKSTNFFDIKNPFDDFSMPELEFRIPFEDCLPAAF